MEDKDYEKYKENSLANLAEGLMILRADILRIEQSILETDVPGYAPLRSLRDHSAPILRIPHAVVNQALRLALAESKEEFLETEAAMLRRIREMKMILIGSVPTSIAAPETEASQEPGQRRILIRSDKETSDEKDGKTEKAN